MNAGRLDRLITIQQPTQTRDNIGGQKNAWAEYTQVWANYAPNSPDESTNADRVEAKEDAVFTIRYSTTSAAITNKMRVSFDSKTYNIVAIDEITRRGYLKLRTIATK